MVETVEMVEMEEMEEMEDLEESEELEKVSLLSEESEVESESLEESSGCVALSVCQGSRSSLVSITCLLFRTRTTCTPCFFPIRRVAVLIP